LVRVICCSRGTDTFLGFFFSNLYCTPCYFKLVVISLNLFWWYQWIKLDTSLMQRFDLVINVTFSIATIGSVTRRFHCLRHSNLSSTKSNQNHSPSALFLCLWWLRRQITHSSRRLVHGYVRSICPIFQSFSIWQGVFCEKYAYDWFTCQASSGSMWLSCLFG